METFGQKLRQAVASQGLRLDQLVKSTGLPIEHIQALACDDFSALPDDAIVEKGLRHFARLVNVDPDPVIEDYHQERQRWQETQAPPVEAVNVPAEHHESVEIGPYRPSGGAQGKKSEPDRTTGIATPALAILSIAVVIFFIWFRSSATGLSRPPALVESTAPMTEALVDAPKPGVPATATIPQPGSSIRPPGPVEQGSAIKQPNDATFLSIPRHGVGRGVVDHELVSEAEHFSEGERVWFWTLVEGGAAGESIDHVWIHEGVEALRVPLSLGGARWRTQSYKQMIPGSSGRWSVEARDETGRVLARREFVCSSRP